MKQAQRCDKEKIEQTGWSPFGNSLTRRELSETTLTLCHHIKSPNMYVYQSATLVFLYLNRNIFSGHGLRCPYTGLVIVDIIIITITITMITTPTYRHHHHLLRSRTLVSAHWTVRRSAPGSHSPPSSPSTSHTTASPPCRLSTASRLWRGKTLTHFLTRLPLFAKICLKSCRFAPKSSCAISLTNIHNCLTTFLSTRIHANPSQSVSIHHD